MAVDFKVDHKRGSEYRFLPSDILIKPELNGRHDKPDIEPLIVDILKRGQHTPVSIRNDGGTPVLISGFSRWRAVSEINRRGLAPMPMVLRCTFVQCSESEAFLHNISENRFRNATTPIDDAHNIKRLLNVFAMVEEDIATVYFPTAKTPQEIKEARKFVRDRIALISLTPEAEKAVSSGRITETAAKAIAKLSESQQHEVLKKKGTIERKDVTPAKPKAAKPQVLDAELRRRVAVLLDDETLLKDIKTENPYVEVSREALVALGVHNRMIYFIELLLLLFGGHALCDYPLQGDFLSQGKNRLLKGVPWYQCLWSHALIHSCAVLVITRYMGHMSLKLALYELVIHAATDYSKGKHWISFNTDQTIHFGCKIAWALYVVTVLN